MIVSSGYRYTLYLATLLLLAVPAGAQQVRVQDMGLKVGFQDIFQDHLQRGRANIAADFNLDGTIDFFIGNPGDTSVIMVGVPGQGRSRFKVAQVLLVDEVAWGAAALDYDNDGDYDLFVTIGGNENIGFDYLFKNLWLETGQLRFEDVTDAAGVAGPVPPGESNPIKVGSANAVAADYDRDGDTDLFVNVNVAPVSVPQIKGRNILWSNNGDGTFSDVTDAVGLGVLGITTRHSTFLDVDNDGDVDLFENNLGSGNILRRNLLVETGSAVFEDATDEFSPPGQDLHFPSNGFASATADFNNDGWQDLLVFFRGPDRPERDSPYLAGHALFLNQAGTGFVNEAEVAGLNNPYIGESGVMGSQVGDVDFDGIPDVFIGNGGPTGGQFNQLYLSVPRAGQVPEYLNRSDLIDFAAPEKGSSLIYPTYPYRTHGTTFVDIDGDGGPEIMVVNGGPSGKGDEVREPNRTFQLKVGGPKHYLWVRPEGDGVHVSRDAIGSRVEVEVSNGAGKSWSVHRTLLGGNGFSAQSGFDLFFGIRDAVSIDRITILWPDGTTRIVAAGVELDSKIVVSY